MRRFTIDPMPILSSSFFAVIVAGTIMLTTSGCRFGNFVEKEQVLDRKPRYATRPTKMAFTATINGETRRVGLSVSHVPGELSSFMTDPVILFLDDPKTGRAAFCRNDEQACGTAIFIGSDGVTLGYSGTATPVVLWKSFNRCTDQLSILESGQIVAPRLQVDFTINRAIEGTQCEDALTDMKNCYEDIAQCDGVASSAAIYQQDVRALFDPYIQNGVFTAAEIPQLSNIGYEVSYR